MDAVLARRGCGAIPVGEYKNMVGLGAENLVKSVVNAHRLNASPGTVREILNDYLLEYEKRGDPLTRAYEGVAETLDRLASMPVKLGINSNKPQKQVASIAERLFPGRFSAIIGNSGEFPLKPGPGGALRIADLWNIRPSGIIFAGDSGVDMQTAENAGMYGAGALWGYRTREELAGAGAQKLISSPLQLLAMI